MLTQEVLELEQARSHRMPLNWVSSDCGHAQMRLMTKVHSLLSILLNTLVKNPIVRIHSGFVAELLIFFTAEGFVLIVERLVDIVGFVALV